MNEELSIDDLLGPEITPFEKQSKQSQSSKVPKAPSAPREHKGIMVKFKNKAGEEIVGPGVKYYVVRYQGKLHYKEASQVTIIEDEKILK